MNSRKSWLVVLALQFLALGLWAPLAHAFTAPIQSVTTANVSVGLKFAFRTTVHDPVTNTDVVKDSGAYDEIMESGATGGVAACIGRNGTLYDLYTAVYDPIRGQWMTFTSAVGSQNFVGNQLTIASGVVTFSFPSGAGKIAALYCKTYDPVRGTWSGSSIVANQNITSQNQQGIVACSTMDRFGVAPNYNFVSNIYANIYDARDGTWHTWTTPGSDFIINNASVEYDEGVKGYFPADYNWGDNYTKPLAFFSVQPSSGAVPLTVWYIDLSIGGIGGIVMDLGDGNTSTTPSSWHTYSSAENYILTQTVTNPQGSNTTTAFVSAGTTPPAAYTFQINAGKVATNNSMVDLWSFANPGDKVYYKNNSNPITPFAGPYNGSSHTPWTLPTGEGLQTVYGRFVKADSSVVYVNMSIIYDVTPPTGSMVINAGAPHTSNPAVTLTFTSSDGVNGSGVGTMQLGVAVWDWHIHDYDITWERFWRNKADTLPYTLASGDGGKNVCVRFKDLAGNISSMYVDSIILDTQAPSACSVAINAGAAYTKDPSVILSLQASDATGMKFNLGKDGSSGIVWDTYWVDYTQSFPCSLDNYPAPGYGTHKIYAQFQDAEGHISGPVFATIFLDTVKPTDGTLTATGGKRQVNLSWSGFADANGIQSYRLYYSTKGTPDVTIDPSIPLGTQTSYVHKNLFSSTTYYYKLVALDPAGNPSLGAPASATTQKGSSLPFLMLLLD